MELCNARKIKASHARRGITLSWRRITCIIKKKGPTSEYAKTRFKPHFDKVNETEPPNIVDRGPTELLLPARRSAQPRDHEECGGHAQGCPLGQISVRNLGFPAELPYRQGLGVRQHGDRRAAECFRLQNTCSPRRTPPRQRDRRDNQQDPKGRIHLLREVLDAAQAAGKAERAST